MNDRIAGPTGRTGEPSSEEWDKVLTDGHAPLVRARRVFRYLPSAPRCKMCNNPFGGFGGQVFAAAGFRRSRKNPNLCTRCCDALPKGGAEVDIAVCSPTFAVPPRSASGPSLQTSPRCSTGSTSLQRARSCGTTR